MAKAKDHKDDTSKPFIIGARNFAAITAIEGLKLSPESERRLRASQSLSSAERRLESIRGLKRELSL